MAEIVAAPTSRIPDDTYANFPSIMPAQPWWSNLDAGFHKYPDLFQLDLPTQAVVSGTAFTDVLLRTAGASMLTALALPLGFNPVQIRKDLTEREFYLDLLDPEDPSTFFAEPPTSVEIKRTMPSWPYFDPGEGTCTALSFESPFEPVNPNRREGYLSNENNRIARAQYWHHTGKTRPTIVAIHGFFADPYWLNSWFLDLPWFYEIGCDVLLYTLPFHGARAGTFSPFSGHGFFAGGLVEMNEAFAQAVFDFRIFLDYLLHEQNVPQVGVTGISLGGYTTSILAAVEDRLSFAIPNVPVVSIADLVLEWFPVSTVVKTLMKTQGFDIHDVRHTMAVHSPLTYKPKLDKERLMIVGGAGDRLAPPKHSRLLWDHWGRPSVHWFPGNHVIHIEGTRYRKEMADFLQGIGFLDGIGGQRRARAVL